jgi:ABC-2 type transport system ATP-binding protein
MAPLVEVAGARKTFRARTGAATTALDGVHFEVAPGERVALLGRNGAGKTTLVRAIASLVALDEGSIRVAGRAVGDGPAYLGDVGITLESGRSVYWKLTPWENARYFAGLRGRVDEQRIAMLLDAFAVPHARTREVGRLSTGNRQKVSIVCALAHDPRLLLLDEPTLGLDVEAVAQIQRTIVELAGTRGRAFVITSHDLSFVQEVCDRVLVIDGGRILFDGPLARLRASATGYRVRLVVDGDGDGRARDAGADARWAEATRAELTHAAGKLTICFEAQRADEILKALDRLRPRDDAAVHDVDIHKRGLEAAYLELARGSRP